MILKIPYIIDEILKYRKSSSSVTKRFRLLKHNKNLCPVVEHQIESILDCFIRFHSIAYDTQGINDKGIDVISRYEVISDDMESENRYTAFQIKSYDDLEKKDYLKSLKAQCFEAQKWLGEYLDHYYILLCTSKICHKEKIRQIKQAFTNAINVTIIDPTYMATFIRLSSIRIKSVVTTLLKDDDIIYKKANNDIEEFTPTQAAVYIALISKATFYPNLVIDIEQIRDNAFVRKIYSEVPDYEDNYYFNYEATDLLNNKTKKYKDRKRELDQRFLEDVDTLRDNVFSFGAGGLLEVDLNHARPIQAVLFDGLVRFDVPVSNLLDFVFTSLEVLERYDIDEFLSDEL